MITATSDHLPYSRMPTDGSSWPAKNEQATAALIGAEAPSGQPDASQKPQHSSTVITAPAADHNAMPWSIKRTGAAPASGRNDNLAPGGRPPAAIACLSSRQSIEMSTSSRSRINRLAVMISFHEEPDGNCGLGAAVGIVAHHPG